jgi:hypothetical protein
MQGVTVSCGQHIPEGDGGFVGVSGTVAGQQHWLQLWSRGPAPGTLSYVEVWNGAPPGTGDYFGPPMTGQVTGFDWAREATLNVSLSLSSNPAQQVHISGRIVCGPSYTG